MNHVRKGIRDKSSVLSIKSCISLAFIEIYFCSIHMQILVFIYSDGKSDISVIGFVNVQCYFSNIALDSFKACVVPCMSVPEVTILIIYKMWTPLHSYASMWYSNMHVSVHNRSALIYYFSWSTHLFLLIYCIYISCNHFFNFFGSNSASQRFGHYPTFYANGVWV